MRTTRFDANTIVAFHIGRGGKYHNPNHLSFLGEHSIGDYIDDHIEPPYDEDGNEDFSDDAEYTDDVGNPIGLTRAEVKSGVGRIDMDGIYDTTYTMRLGHVTFGSREWNIIFDSDSLDAEDAQIFLDPRFAIETLVELANYYNNGGRRYDSYVFYAIITRESYMKQDGSIKDRMGNELVLETYGNTKIAKVI